jgi:putative lipoprotein
MNDQYGFGVVPALIASLLALPFSSAGALGATAHVTGSVSIRERIALPPGYVLRVELRDISRQDAPSEEISSVELRPRHQPPIRYSLRFDRRRINPASLYSVSARILIDRRLAFISDQINPVLTRGRPDSADIMLRSVGRR